MRGIVIVLLFASMLVSCKESASEADSPEIRAETTAPEPKQVPPAQATPQPVITTPRVTPIAAPEPVPPSPFLVAPTSTQRPAPDAFQSPPPVVTTPPPSIPPPVPPPPRPWSTSVQTKGKPCPVGRCLLNGKCVIPGGPIAHEGMPPGAVSGACGGDGGECSRCRCVSTGTLLSTPTGETLIEDLRTHDLVWSIHQGRKQVVPILATQRVRVQNHSMARMQLVDGFVLEVSGEHPTGDGRKLWDLQPGDKVGEVKLDVLSVVPYEGMYTYDILPDSDTGTYFVHGMWLGSTMFGQHVRGDVVGEQVVP